MIQIKRKVKEIVRGGGAFIGTVVNVKNESGYFFVRCDGKQVFCHIHEGRQIVAGSVHPEFRYGEVEMPKQGSQVILFVGSDDKGRPYGEMWGHRSDLTAAEDLIASRGSARRPVTQAEARPVSKGAVATPQRKERFWPSIKGGVGRSKLTPDRQFLEAAYAGVEGAAAEGAQA